MEAAPASSFARKPRRRDGRLADESLQGCAGLLRMRNWNGDSEGIVKTCFWAFARIGTSYSLLSLLSCLLPRRFVRALLLTA